MDNSLININREYAIKQFNKQFKEVLNPICNDLIRKNRQISELKTQLITSEKIRVSFARAYATKLGVLITLKQWRKRK